MIQNIARRATYSIHGGRDCVLFAMERGFNIEEFVHEVRNNVFWMNWERGRSSNPQATDDDR